MLNQSAETDALANIYAEAPRETFVRNEASRKQDGSCRGSVTNREAID